MLGRNKAEPLLRVFSAMTRLSLMFPAFDFSRIVRVFSPCFAGLGFGLDCILPVSCMRTCAQLFCIRMLEVCAAHVLLDLHAATTSTI